MFYLDTSVLAAYYCPEPLSEVIEKYITKSRQPAISQLTEVELASAVSKKIREKNLTEKDGFRILNKFQSHIDNRMFRYLPIEIKHYRTAKNWISQFTVPLRTLDAIHLAISALSNVELLTADKRLANSAQRLGMRVTLLNKSN